jgi:hypothetical protein
MLVRMSSPSSATPPNDRERLALGLLLRADERRCSASTLGKLARRGWAAPGAGGAYRLTVAGRALAESLEPPRSAPARTPAR